MTPEQRYTQFMRKRSQVPWARVACRSQELASNLPAFAAGAIQESTAQVGKILLILDVIFSFLLNGMYHTCFCLSELFCSYDMCEYSSNQCVLKVLQNVGRIKNINLIIETACSQAYLLRVLRTVEIMINELLIHCIFLFYDFSLLFISFLFRVRNKAATIHAFHIFPIKRF